MRTIKQQYMHSFKWGCITGAIIGVIFTIAFGVLDVQCWNDPSGRNWDAEHQQCVP